MKPRNKIQPLPFVLPALFIYILTVIIPILWSMGYSLFSWNGIGDMKFIGLENYVRMFQDETFREAVVNNLKFVVLGSLFQFCAGLILAILLTRISKGGNILRVIYFIPCIISSMAICQIFSKMLSVQPQGSCEISSSPRVYKVVKDPFSSYSASTCESAPFVSTR